MFRRSGRRRGLDSRLGERAGISLEELSLGRRQPSGAYRFRVATMLLEPCAADYRASEIGVASRTISTNSSITARRSGSSFVV